MLNDLIKKANDIRQATTAMCCRAGKGHITSGFSCTEILVSLYYGGVLKHDPKKPNWEERDRLVMSKGHGSTALYPILADRGYFPVDNLKKYCQPGAPIGILLRGDVPGVEMTCGSVGFGLGFANGLAMAARMSFQNHMVYCVMGDAELNEGTVWESFMFAGHYRLNNLVAYIDRNYLGVTDWTENMMGVEPLVDKIRAFGWQPVVLAGHDIRGIVENSLQVKRRLGSRPVAFICLTTKGYGAPSIENQPLWHGIAPQDAMFKIKGELGG